MEKFNNKFRIPSTRLQNWDYGWDAAYFITICTKNKKHYFGEVINGRMVLSHEGIIADIMWYEIVKHHKHVLLDAFVVMPNHLHGIIIIHHDKLMDGDGVIHNPVEPRHALALPESVPYSDSVSHSDSKPHSDPESHPDPKSHSDSKPHIGSIPHSDAIPDIEPLADDPMETDSKCTSSFYQLTNYPTEHEIHCSKTPFGTLGQKRFQNQGKNSLSSILGSYKSAVTKHVHRLGLDCIWQERFFDRIVRDEEAHTRIQQYIINNPKNWEKDRFNT